MLGPMSSDPVTPPPAAISASGNMSRTQRIVQLLGLIIGIALMIWALSLASGGDNRQALENLRNASPRLVAALIILSLLSIALDAITFWIAMLPRRRLPLGEVMGTNAIAVFLSILPFKLGMIIRSAIHVRRHKVELKSLVSWFIAFGGVTMAAIAACAGGAILASRFWQQPSLFSTVAVATGLLLAAWCVIVGVGQISRRSGNTFLRVLTLGTTDLISSPGAVAAGLMIRTLDIATFAARFAIAGAILGVSLTAAESAQLGSVYLLLNAGAPAGALGFAEAGTAGAAKMIGINIEDGARLALLTTAVRLATAGCCAACAWMWLRPDRLLRKQS